MIELLVTLVIIATALLGTAGLQALALKMTQDSQIRSQAILLGRDLYERIEANNSAAIAGNYAVTTLPTSFSQDCAAQYCPPAALATYDLAVFNGLMQDRLPGSTATISFAGTGPFTYTIQINWTTRITRSSNTTLDSSGTVSGGGQTETFAFTFSKTIYNRSAVF